MAQFELTATQKKHLREVVARTQGAGKLRRALALLDIDEGKTADEADRRLGVSKRSIYRWIEGLRLEAKLGVPKWSPDLGGRPNVWSDELEEFLEALLAHKPDQLGYLATG